MHFPTRELLVRSRLCPCPMSLPQARFPCDLVPCGAGPAQGDVPIPVPAAELGQLCVPARAGALGRAPDLEVLGKLCRCWTGKAVLHSELVRVLQALLGRVCSSSSAPSWDLPLHSLAVPGRGTAACCAGTRGGGGEGGHGHRWPPQHRLPSPHSYAVIAYGCAECPRLTCGREGCGTEFCYHCRQPWHPDGPCAPMPPAPSLANPAAQLAHPEDAAHGETLSRGGSKQGRDVAWPSSTVRCLCTFLPAGMLEPGPSGPTGCHCVETCASQAGGVEWGLAVPGSP